MAISICSFIAFLSNGGDVDIVSCSTTAVTSSVVAVGSESAELLSDFAGEGCEIRLFLLNIGAIFYNKNKMTT